MLKRIVIDLNALRSAHLSQMILWAHREPIRFVIPSFALEELTGDDDRWPRTFHEHAKELAPIRHRVDWTRDSSKLWDDEINMEEPVRELTDEDVSRVLRSLLVEASISEERAAKAFNFVPEAQREPNVRRDLSRIGRTHDPIADLRETVKPAHFARLQSGDYSELVLAVTYRAIRSAMRALPNFLNWPVERQRRFVAKSLICRAAASGFALGSLYVARGRFKVGKVEALRSDRYDTYYSVFGSMLEGLESDDVRGVQRPIYEVLRRIPDCVASHTAKHWIEIVEEIASNPDEVDDLDLGD